MSAIALCYPLIITLRTPDSIYLLFHEVQSDSNGYFASGDSWLVLGLVNVNLISLALLPAASLSCIEAFAGCLYYGGNLKSKKINKTGSKKGSKSGLLPSSYQSLTDDEKTQVNAAFLAYKQNSPKDPYLIVDQFYYHVYRKGNWFAGTTL